MLLIINPIYTYPDTIKINIWLGQWLLQLYPVLQSEHPPHLHAVPCLCLQQYIHICVYSISTPATYHLKLYFNKKFVRFKGFLTATFHLECSVCSGIHIKFIGSHLLLYIRNPTFFLFKIVNIYVVHQAHLSALAAPRGILPAGHQ